MEKTKKQSPGRRKREEEEEIHAIKYISYMYISIVKIK